MAFCITFGTQEFTSQLEGYEHVQTRCMNCGNFQARCITRWPWFTVCFIPVIPLATHKYKEVHCPVCRFSQDMRDRPDVTQGGQGVQGQQQPQYYPPGPNQGWGGQGQPPQGPPPGGAPQYK